MINPTVVEGQIFGGVVQGIGGVLLENFVYDDDGNPLTTTFMDYLLPTTTEVPEIEVGHIETAPRPTPAGSRAWARAGRSAPTPPSPTPSATPWRRSASTSPHTARPERHPPSAGRGGRGDVTDEEKLAVGEAYRVATEANDAEVLRAIHEPDAITWHNLDGLSVSVDDSPRSLAWLHRTVPDLRLRTCA